MKTIVVLLDETGSMEPNRAETIQAYNSYIANIRSEDVKFHLTLFNSAKIEKRYKGIDAADLPDLTKHGYNPANFTPLYDAIGKTISDINTPALLVIVTDGQENASKEYTLEGIKNLMKHKEDDGWEFLFLASDLNVVNQAIIMNVSSVRIGETQTVTHAFDTATLSTSDYIRGKTQRSAKYYADTAKGTSEEE